MTEAEEAKRDGVLGQDGQRRRRDPGVGHRLTEMGAWGGKGGEDPGVMRNTGVGGRPGRGTVPLAEMGARRRGPVFIVGASEESAVNVKSHRHKAKTCHFFFFTIT